MSPAKPSEILDREIWPSIQYLDPDLESAPGGSRDKPESKKETKRVALFAALTAIYVVAILLALGFFRVIALAP